MKTAAGELPHFGLRLVQHRAFQPTGTDDTISLVDPLHQIVQSVRWRGAIRVHIGNNVRQWREPETFNQRAAFADGLAKFLGADEWIIGSNTPHDAQSVIPAAVEDDDKLKLSVVFRLEVFRVIAQNRLDAALFIIGRDEEQQAGLGHGSWSRCARSAEAII